MGLARRRGARRRGSGGGTGGGGGAGGGGTGGMGGGGGDGLGHGSGGGGLSLHCLGGGGGLSLHCLGGGGLRGLRFSFRAARGSFRRHRRRRRSPLGLGGGCLGGGRDLLGTFGRARGRFRLLLHLCRAPFIDFAGVLRRGCCLGRGQGDGRNVLDQFALGRAHGVVLERQRR